MTFNDNADISTGKVTRHGRNTAIGVGGGGGIIAIIVLLISVFSGTDLTGLLGAGGGAPAGPAEQLNCTVEQANTDIDCRVQGAMAAIDAYWVKKAPDLGISYVTPSVDIFSGQLETGCGTASTAVGPFYCPPDQGIYLDTAFYQQLEQQFGASAGSLAQMYVLSHEWGHHIQNISGIMEGKNLQDTGPTSDSVRLELQADCLAGAWAGAASTTPDKDGVYFLKTFTDAQLADALNAAATVGDDNIQEKTQGQTNPEGWTHGSSEQRQQWFTVGLEQGPESCDTFAVAADQL